jgi:hypothetical protein
MIITTNDIEQLEQRYRTAFINSLAGFRQAVLVGYNFCIGKYQSGYF